MWTRESRGRVISILCLTIYPRADMFSILGVYDALANSLNTVGVLNNMLYDIIPSVDQSQGTVTVNATTITVDCGVLRGLEQHTATRMTTGNNVDYLQYTFTASDLITPNISSAYIQPEAQGPEPETLIITPMRASSACYISSFG